MELAIKLITITTLVTSVKWSDANKQKLVQINIPQQYSENVLPTRNRIKLPVN